MSDDSGIDKLTPKQQAFVEAYLECGNAAEAYRRAYSCANMGEATVQREATRLLANHKVNHTITTLRAQAAEKAALSRSWVLERLMENTEVALGRKTIKLRVPRKDKESGKTEVTEIEVSAHDGHVAAKSLQLLGQTDEIRLFVQRVEATGKDGRPLMPAEASSREVARAILDVLRTAQVEGAAVPTMLDDADDREIEDNEIGEVSTCTSPSAGADLTPEPAAGDAVTPAAAPSRAEQPRARVRIFNSATGRLE